MATTVVLDKNREACQFPVPRYQRLTSNGSIECAPDSLLYLHRGLSSPSTSDRDLALYGRVRADRRERRLQPWVAGEPSSPGPLSRRDGLLLVNASRLDKCRRVESGE